MRTFIVALILFFITAFLIIFNYIYILNVSNEFISAVSEIESAENAESGLSRLKDKWQKEKKLLSFSINHNDISKISSSIVSAEAFLKSNDSSQFKNSIALLRQMFLDLKRFERISFENLF